jgi:hypothetical protein
VLRTGSASAVARLTGAGRGMLSGIGEDQHVKGIWDAILAFVPVHGQRIGTARRAYMLAATDFGDPDILASSPAVEHACNTVAVSMTAVLVRLSMEWALVVQLLNQTPQFALDRVLEMSHCEWVNVGCSAHGVALAVKRLLQAQPHQRPPHHRKGGCHGLRMSTSRPTMLQTTSTTLWGRKHC